KALPGLKLFHDGGDVVLSDVEDHPDRLQLRDECQTILVIRVDNVSRIDLAQADSSRERRGDARVRELQLRAFDWTLVRFDRSFILFDRGSLGIELLLGNGVLAVQDPVTFQINACICEKRLVALHLTFGLRELNLKGTRIYFRNQISGRNHLSFANGDPQEFSINAASERHCIQSSNGAQAIEVNRLISCFSRRSDHRYCRHRCGLRRFGAAVGPAASLKPMAEEQCNREKHDKYHEPPEPAVNVWNRHSVTIL